MNHKVWNIKQIHKYSSNEASGYSTDSSRSNLIARTINRYLFPLFSLLTFNFLLADRASAICGVCTGAAVAGVGLTRWLGIDDLVSGLWVGGALASVTGWTINWLNKKEIRFKGRKILVALLYYGFVVIPFYYYDIATHPRNKYIHEAYIGIDKLILSIAIGTVFFVIANKTYEYFKAKNNGRAHFPFEKVVFPIGTLVILSVIAYFVTK